MNRSRQAFHNVFPKPSEGLKGLENWECIFPGEQVVREPACPSAGGGLVLSWEVPWGGKMATHSTVLAWEMH